ncbi:MAG: SpoIID/LytB domain-containing protein [Ilumatobacteraceae bacterium]
MRTRLVRRVKWQSRGQLVGWQQEGQTWTVRMSGTTVLLTDHTGRVRYQRAAPIRSLQMLHSGIPTTLRTFQGSSPYLVRRNKWDETHFLYNAGTLDVQQRFRDRADNGTAMDKYLYGVIEVPETWPAAALGAQAIAGRTFATKVNRVLHPHSVDQAYRRPRPDS